MNMLAFDTHAAVKRLTAHGLTEEQAESIVSVIGESADQRLANLATKDELKAECTTLEHKIDLLDQKIDLNSAQLKNDLIKWMLGSQALLLGALVALSNFTKLL